MCPHSTSLDTSTEVGMHADTAAVAHTIQHQQQHRRAVEFDTAPQATLEQLLAPDPFAPIASQLVPPYYTRRNRDVWQHQCITDAPERENTSEHHAGTQLHRADFIQRWVTATTMIAAPVAAAERVCGPTGGDTDGAPTPVCAPAVASGWTCVDEEHLVRETCWMLYGLESWVYQHSVSNEARGARSTDTSPTTATPPVTPPCVVVRAREDLIGVDKTPRALARCLAGFAAVGTVLVPLRRFLAEVNTPPDIADHEASSAGGEGSAVPGCNTTNVYGTRTYRAFAVSLAQIVTDFENGVRQQEVAAASAPRTTHVCAYVRLGVHAYVAWLLRLMLVVEFFSVQIFNVCIVDL